MPTVEWNKKAWTNNVAFAESKLDIENYGDHWGTIETKPHLKKMLERHLQPYVGPEINALEIGSGGGRWTQYMVPCKSIVCVDVNEVMIELLQKRFADFAHLSYVLTDGSSIDGVADKSIDFVYSHGVFVHIDPLEIYDYLVRIRQLVKDDATLVIQYADQDKKAARENKGFARNNPRLMRAMVEHAGFNIVEEDIELLHHSSVMRFEPVV